MEISLPAIKNPVEVTLDNFDIDEYCREYNGTTKLNRLLFIAECCSTLQEQALAHSLFFLLLRSQFISLSNVSLRIFRAFLPHFCILSFVVDFYCHTSYRDRIFFRKSSHFMTSLDCHFFSGLSYSSQGIEESKELERKHVHEVAVYL